MALDEKILEDSNWETKGFYADFKAGSIHVHVTREHKFEGHRIVSDISLDMNQAKELGLRLVSLAHDHTSET